MIKLNMDKVAEDSAPYNEIYDAHPEFFKDILAGRRPFFNDADYVCMEQPEKQLIHFIKSKDNGICLLYGHRGIGKTTLIEHVKTIMQTHKEYNKYEVIKLDLNARLIGVELPDGFFNLDENDRSDKAREIVDNFIVKNFMAIAFNFLKESLDYNDLFEFVCEYNGDAIMPAAAFTTTLEQKINVLKNLAESQKVLYSYILVKYMLFKKGCEKLVVIIDNCDLKSDYIVNQIYSKMAHFICCIIEKMKPIEKACCIIACRPYTKNKMLKNKNNNPAGAYLLEKVNIDTPCSLVDIIRKRYKNMSSNSDISILTDTGVKITIDKRNEFLLKIVEYLEKEGIEKVILEFCNYDISSALTTTLSFIRNRYFYNIEEVIPDVMPDIFLAKEREHTSSALNWATILNSAAYGNPAPGKQLIYPIENTIIANILDWDKNDKCTFLARIRVIQFLVKFQCISMDFKETGCGIIDVLEFLQLYLKIAPERGRVLLNKMFKDDLIFTHDNVAPIVCDLRELITVSPKGQALYEYFTHVWSHLIEIYMDDTWVEDDLFSDSLPVRRSSFENRSFKLISFLQFFTRMECEQLESIYECGKLHEFLVKTGNKPLICRLMLHNIEKNINSFYLPRISSENAKNELRNELNKTKEIIKSFQDEISKQTQVS